MHDNLILIGLGSNLPGPDGTSPSETLRAALEELNKHGVRVIRRSRWYRSSPVQISDQPWFVNGVAAVEFEGQPVALLQVLQDVEAQFGRRRRVKNEARPIDLDILAFGNVVTGGGEEKRSAHGLDVPHPEMHRRAFVLMPLAEVAADWRHPVSRQSVGEMIAHLPSDQVVEPLDE